MDDPAPPPRLVDALAVALRVRSRSLAEVLEREEGVSFDQWRTLRSLSRHTGRSMRELTDRLQIPPPSVTRLIDTLVDRALVYRHANPVDRRSVEVLLSDAGWVLLGRLEELARVDEERQHPTEGMPTEQLTMALEQAAGLPPSLRSS